MLCRAYSSAGASTSSAVLPTTAAACPLCPRPWCKAATLTSSNGKSTSRRACRGGGRSSSRPARARAAATPSDSGNSSGSGSGTSGSGTSGSSGSSSAAAARGAQPAPASAPRHLPSAVVERYAAVADPVRHRVTYSAALQGFIAAAVEAYECGYSEDLLLGDARAAYLVRQMGDESFDESPCWRLISLVWVTCDLCPAPVQRWGTGPAVHERTLAHWRGFVGLLLDAYFARGWSAYPTDRLIAERSFTTGARQRPELVAESARVVFETLARVAPQFPA